MPFDALHQPAYTSAEWSVNDAPVRGSTPTMIVGMPVLYVCGTARSGSTCCIATAMTSPTSAPGWCVPALTGLPGSGLSTQPFGTTSLICSKKPFVLRDLGIHHRGDLPDRVAARVAVRRPRLQLGPRVGAREVDRERVALDGDLHVEVDVGIAERIVVDVHVGLVDAVGPLPRPPRGSGGPRSRSCSRRTPRPSSAP